MEEIYCPHWSDCPDCRFFMQGSWFLCFKSAAPPAGSWGCMYGAGGVCMRVPNHRWCVRGASGLPDLCTHSRHWAAAWQDQHRQEPPLQPNRQVEPGTHGQSGAARLIASTGTTPRATSSVRGTSGEGERTAITSSRCSCTRLQLYPTTMVQLLLPSSHGSTPHGRWRGGQCRWPEGCSGGDWTMVVR